MSSPYPAYGVGPNHAYPNAPPLNSAAGYSHAPNMSVDSEISDEAYKEQNHSSYPGAASDVRLNMSRTVTRTPSPTPSEQTELSRKHLIDLQAMRHLKFWFRREWLWHYVIIIVLCVISILFTVFHEQIVRWIQPTANKIQKLPAGWLIPVGILFVISFPPLFGHEIVAIICGVVWGLWIGFAIVCAGSFLGEIGNFYAFRYCCSSRGEKMEKRNVFYGCLARVIRDGGFKIALIARFSAIPGHFTTAVFSTCGMNIWVFMAAAFLSLPKQFITVYLGVALEDSEDGQTSKKDTIIKAVVLVVTIAVTFVTMWYIYSLMMKAKPAVIYERRKARQEKMLSESSVSVPYGNPSVMRSTASVGYDANVSESELPLTANFNNGSSFQQWDASGHAVGYAPDPTLFAPQPQRPATRLPLGGGGGSQPGSSQASSAPTPTLHEQSRPPASRQNTAGSWDARPHVGGAEAIKMTASPQPHYRDPYASPAPARLPPPPGPPPASTTTTTTQALALQAGAYTQSPEPTPTQAQYAYYRPPSGPPPPGQSPQSAPLSNPYDRSPAAGAAAALPPLFPQQPQSADYAYGGLAPSYGSSSSPSPRAR